MILAVRCDQPSFKNVHFGAGLNVILAEKTDESSDKDSRNGLGKTTLVEIIHFCLGAKTRKNKGLLKKQLDNWTFSLDILLRSREYAVSRNTSKPGRVVIEGDWSNWPIKPKVDPGTRTASMPVREWNTVLGWLLFDLPVECLDNASRYAPSFRNLISYFARRGRDAFSTPFEHYRKQKEWERQVDNTFLLDLGWEHAQHWQLIKDTEKALKDLKKAASDDFFPNLIGSIGKLETDRIRLENEITSGRQQLDTFNVHPQYHDIEEEASSLTSSIHKLSNENFRDHRLIDTYRQSTRDEKHTDPIQVEKIYREIGLAFPDIVLRRLQDVATFHAAVTANRREFLAAEISQLETAVKERDARVKALSEKRSSLLRVLESHGALEEYLRLNENHVSKVARLESLKQRIESLRKLEEAKSARQIEQAKLHLEAVADHDARHSALEAAVSVFNGNSEALYQAPGKLVVDVSQTGFKFDIEIERSDSQGIEQMKVFCYDLMLAQLWAKKAVGPRFLVHDSTIYDGVDERQVARALELACRKAGECGFQYICSINSDDVPWELFNSCFNLKDYIRLTLTDAKEDGGLLGIRF